MKHLATAIVAAVATLANGAVMAEVVENVTLNYYKVPVTAEVLADKKRVVKAIEEATPIRAIRDWHTISKTDTNISWGLDMTGGKGLCKIRAFKVDLQAGILLPKLEGIGVVDTDRLNSYNRYFEQHEQEHLKIARRTASKVSAAIGSLKPMENCNRMQEEINATGRALTLAGKDEEQSFDLLVAKQR